MERFPEGDVTISSRPLAAQRLGHARHRPRARQSDEAMWRDGCITAPSAAVSCDLAREDDRELVEDDADSALFGSDWTHFFKPCDWKRFAASPLASQNLLEESLDFLEESAAAEVKRRKERKYTSPVPEPMKADKARTGTLSKHSCEGITASALSRGLTMPILPQQSLGNGRRASPNISWDPSTQIQPGASVMHAGPPWNSRIQVQQPPVQPMLMRPFNDSLSNQSGQTLLIPRAGATLAPKSAAAQSQDRQPPMRALHESQAISIFLEKRSGNKDHNLSGRLAHRYGVTSKTVRDIWRMRTWRRSTEPFWTLSDRQEFLRHQTAHVPNSKCSFAGS